MKVFMVIVFILANGQEVMLNGWSPSAYESMNVGINTSGLSTQ